VKDPHLLPMQRTGKSPATNNNNKKAKILTERFFLQLAPADLNNITSKTLATCLRVNSNMTTEKMAKTISCLLNNKALRLNGIPNKALKTCSPLIALWLADIAKACFAIGHYLRLERAITTIVLCKKDKANYLISGSYCPIALENTLNKILKKVITNCMTDTAKKHTLLLQSQMGARKNHLTLSVLTLLAATIKSA